MTRYEPKHESSSTNSGHDDIAVDVLSVIEEVAVNQLGRDDYGDRDRKPDPPVSKEMPPH